MKPDSLSALNRLTWEDLTQWAGDRVVRRGKSYKHRVEDLCVTPDGALLAWVQGRSRYATLIRQSPSGVLSSVCTCPYRTSCKHAVATLLRYLDGIQEQAVIPAAESDDERFAQLEAEPHEDEEINEEDEVSPLSSSPSHGSGDDPIRDYLTKCTKAQLFDLLLQEQSVIPELRLKLADQKHLREGNHKKLITETRKEIDRVTREPGWQNHWQHEGYTPDYSRLTQRLEHLLNAGHPDAVVELGTYLLPKGMSQAASSDDEGETSNELLNSLTVVYRALALSTLSPARQILWDIDAHLLDPYDMLRVVKGPIETFQQNQAATWSLVADQLQERLASMPPRQEEKYSSSPYLRNNLRQWLIQSLEHAGRESDIIPLLQREIFHSHCYLDLIQRLLKAKRRDEARSWAKTGIEATAEKFPDIARQLEDALLDLAEQEKNAPLSAAFRARAFFLYPGLKTFLEMQNAATKAKVWYEIRPRIHRFLETGQRPDLPVTERPRKGDKLSPPVPWPLPSTGLADPPPSSHRDHVPNTGVLIEIAIHEKRPEEILHWYHLRQPSGSWSGGYFDEQVANALESTHPNEAIALWKKRVTLATAAANRATYSVAGDCLLKIRSVLTRMGQEKEWKIYLESIRHENKRRPRMMDVLNKLENRRTPIVTPETNSPIPTW